MAVDSHVLVVTPASVVSQSSSRSTSSSISLPIHERQRRVQVATANSSTFIAFPQHFRQGASFVPLCRSRASVSSTRLSSITTTTDTQSVSNVSKLSSHNPSSPLVRPDHQRSNPILNNPLLNHRKEQLLPNLPARVSPNTSHTARLRLSSTPTSSDPPRPEHPKTRASTAPLLAHQPPDRQIENDTDDEPPPFLDEVKYDYITRWLHEVRLATDSAWDKKRSKQL